MYRGVHTQNPSELSCWKLCTSCYRCQDKGRYSKCGSCSGRHDPLLKRDPYDRDDHCRCKEGILQFRLQSGKMVIKKFLSDPFAGKVHTDAESQDERDWNSFINEKREQLDDPDWDPIKFTDGTASSTWLDSWRRGRNGS